MTDDHHDHGPALSVADMRARIATATEAARRAADTDPDGWALRRVEHPAAPDGFAVYRAGPPDGAGMVTMLPALLPTAPHSIQHRYLMRVLANLTGRCDVCGAVAGIAADAPDPEHGRRAAFHVLPVTVGITHAPDCLTGFTDAERRWFDPRALGTTDDQRGDSSGRRRLRAVDPDDDSESDR